jgi:hypothetical protein
MIAAQDRAQIFGMAREMGLNLRDAMLLFRRIQLH